MATFQSLQMTAPRYPVSGPGIGGRSIKAERAEFNLSAALEVGDIIELFRLHPRFRVTDGYIKTDGMGAAVTLNIGDTDDVDRYFAATAATAAGVTRMTAATGFDHLNPGRYTTVNATIAGATTGTTGTLVVYLFGYIEEAA